MLATNGKACTTQNITPVNGPFGNLKSPIRANNANVRPARWNPRFQVGIPSRQITKIQITTDHDISFNVINQVSMYFSVRLETNRSQLFIVTSHTGIKPRCLFKLIPHKAFSLSDNLHIDLEHSQVFKVYCIFEALHSYYSTKSASIYIWLHHLDLLSCILSSTG